MAVKPKAKADLTHGGDRGWGCGEMMEALRECLREEVMFVLRRKRLQERQGQGIVPGAEMATAKALG